MYKTLAGLVAAALLVLGTASIASGMMIPPRGDDCRIRCDGNNDDPGPDLDPICIVDCVPTKPDPQDEADAAAAVCNAALGELRKVLEEQVAAFAHPDGVKIVPVCERSASINRLAKIDPSQALPVRDEIAANPARTVRSASAAMMPSTWSA